MYVRNKWGNINICQDLQTACVDGDCLLGRVSNLQAHLSWLFPQYQTKHNFIVVFCPYPTWMMIHCFYEPPFHHQHSLLLISIIIKIPSSTYSSHYHHYHHHHHPHHQPNDDVQVCWLPLSLFNLFISHLRFHFQ